MTSWKTYRLGDVVNILDNRRIPLSARQREQRRGEYPYYGAQGIIDYVDDYLFDGTYLLIAEDGENLRSKKQNIAQLVSGKYWVNNHAHILESNGLCDIRYICYLLNIIDISGYITGSAQPKLNQANLLAISISLPSLEEQRRIAGILGAIDDKIENNRRINTNLELQAQALYKQWFVDFEFPNEEGKPYKSSGGKMVDSELGQIPEGWRVGDIYKDIKVIYGAPYKSSLFNERKEGNPLIRIRDLKTFSPQYYTQEILPNTEYVNAGDVVAGMDAEFVPCLWMGKKGVLNQRCCKFVGKQDGISNYYVMFLVKPELEFVQSYKTGTTVSHLGKADIDKFVVVQPPFAVIAKFSKIADALLNNKIKLAKENITLATLRDTLLPKLMNGEIKL